MTLCERLKNRISHRKWLVFLDNLFLNVDVAYALLQLNVGVMGTIRKNLSDFPKVLLDIKDINKVLEYGGHLVI